MKKIVCLFFMLLMIAGLSSCNTNEPSNELETVDIYLPDGTPALAMANILDEGFTFKNAKTNFHIVPADQIGVNIIKNADLGIMPITAAAKIHAQAKIKLASVNVFGSLHLVGTNELEDVSKLKGKLVYVTTGTTIDMMKYILTKNNIEFVEQADVVEGKVALSSMPSASDIIPLLKKATMTKTEAYGVLGEPVVTKAMTANPDLKLTFDLQKLYKDIQGSEGYPQAGLVVKTAFNDTYSDYVEALINKLKENQQFCLNHTDTLPSIFKKYDSTLQGMTFTKETIERSNIRIEQASAIQNDIKTYIKDLAGLDVEDSFFC